MELHILLAILALALPLAGFVIIGLCGKIAKGWAKYLGATTMGVTLALSIALLIMVILHGEAFETVSFTWLSTGKYVLDFGLQIDSLAVIMMVVVSTVSFLVHLFSIDYMRVIRVLLDTMQNSSFSQLLC